MGAHSLRLLLLTPAFIFLVALADVATARDIGQLRSGRCSWRSGVGDGAAGNKLETLQVARSSLPDCSHACGSCTPCNLVMVSFVCATLQEAETCPMAYKCMCKSKSYPVP
ncbi:protein EPIDERMAL PATTERNING FACTOR 1 [Curcuma longa]|uniref:protein EPIDERMAL PATTERNING FACTOR 1 n=1 Tax=Curcuma longa TaxID=136217 RepID=UPI003D9E9211